jgi:hypothetical protein
MYTEQGNNIENCKKEVSSNIQGKYIKITADLPTETLKAKRVWNIF